MSKVSAFLLVEHSQSDPEARYTLYSPENGKRVQDVLAEKGWLTEHVETLQLNGQNASYGTILALMDAVARNNIDIFVEDHIWIGED